MIRGRFPLALAVSVGGVLLPIPQPALAQSAPSSSNASSGSAPALKEIIVTATRQKQNAQDVPIADTAITGSALQQLGISSARQLSDLAPTLMVDQGYSSGRTNVSIRGLAADSYALETISPVATYIDGVYQASQFGIATQVFDMNRIEVLRGPQGTLFGRNTTGGALAYYSQTPVQDVTEGYVTLDAGGGEFDRYSAEGALNVPLTDTLASRFSFRVEHTDPYIHNLYDGSTLGKDTNYNARLQFAWKPSDETDVNLKIFGLSNGGDGPVYYGLYRSNPCNEAQPIPTYFDCSPAGQPTPQPPDLTHVYVNKPLFENYGNYGVTLEINHEVGGNTLTSISDVQKGYYDLGTNDQGSLADYFHSRQQSVDWQASEELRLATALDRPVHGVAGLYAEHDHIDANEGSVSTALGPPFDYSLDTHSDTGTTALAAFGSVTYQITRMFALVGGLRYTHEHEVADLDALDQCALAVACTETLTNADDFYTSAFPSYDPTQDLLTLAHGAGSWQRFTWDATADVKPTENALLYAKVATGFRSGAFFNAPSGSTAAMVSLKPEVVTSYEVGFKTEWLNHRLRVNGDGFYMTYKNMQVQTTNPYGAGLEYSNAASSTVRGAELEVDAIPVRGLKLHGSIGYTDARYQSFNTLQFGVPVNLSGHFLPYAPQWTDDVSAMYELPVGISHSMTFETDWSYRSRIFFDPNNITVDSSHYMGSLRIGYGAIDKGWRFTAYGDNLLNERVIGFAYFLAGATSTMLEPVTYEPTRTWGLEANYSF